MLRDVRRSLYFVGSSHMSLTKSQKIFSRALLSLMFLTSFFGEHIKFDLKNYQKWVS